MEEQIKIDYLSPSVLKPNAWNTNMMSPENESKLDNAIGKFGMFKPVVVRTRTDGSLEILGGEHRVESAIRLGIEKVPVINLGEVSDDRAKEIGLVDNGRYGADDALALADLLESLGAPQELADFLPYTEAEFTSLFNNSSIDLDELELDEDEEDMPTEKLEKTVKTHQMMRFKVPVEDSEFITDIIESIMRTHGYVGEDSLTNAGDALVHVMRQFVKDE